MFETEKLYVIITARSSLVVDRQGSRLMIAEYNKHTIKHETGEFVGAINCYKYFFLALGILLSIQLLFAFYGSYGSQNMSLEGSFIPLHQISVGHEDYN